MSFSMREPRTRDSVGVSSRVMRMLWPRSILMQTISRQMHRRSGLPRSLEQDYVVAFGVVQDRPSRFGLNQLFLSDGGDCRLQVRHFKKEDRLIERGIGFGAFALEAYETSAAVKLGVVPDLLVRKLEAQSVDVESLCLIQVFEVELNADESCLDVPHSSVSRILSIQRHSAQTLSTECGLA